VEEGDLVKQRSLVAQGLFAPPVANASVSAPLPPQDATVHDADANPPLFWSTTTISPATAPPPNVTRKNAAASKIFHPWSQQCHGDDQSSRGDPSGIVSFDFVPPPGGGGWCPWRPLGGGGHDGALRSVFCTIPSKGEPLLVDASEHLFMLSQFYLLTGLVR
jgi:hypothetical protein